MTTEDTPREVGSSASLGLLPELEGQPDVMTIAGCRGDVDAGHWYSPAAVQVRVNAAVATERERSAELCEQVADRYAGKSGPQSIVAQLCATVVRGA